METTNKMNIFDMLSAVDVTGHTEKRNGLTYLSWAWAWTEIKHHFPDASYRVYENKDGWFYHTDGRTAWVKTGVTVQGVEYIEMLPVMDVRNRSIPLEHVTSMDVNKAIQRSLTKAIARHGLGISIYNGSFDDLPEEQTPVYQNRVIPNPVTQKRMQAPDPEPAEDEIGKIRGEIIDILGSVEAVDEFIRSKSKTKQHLHELDKEQLITVRDILKAAKERSEKHE